MKLLRGLKYKRCMTSKPSTNSSLHPFQCLYSFQSSSVTSLRSHRRISNVMRCPKNCWRERFPKLDFYLQCEPMIGTNGIEFETGKRIDEQVECSAPDSAGNKRGVYHETHLKHFLSHYRLFDLHYEKYKEIRKVCLCGIDTP